MLILLYFYLSNIFQCRTFTCNGVFLQCVEVKDLSTSSTTGYHSQVRCICVHVVALFSHLAYAFIQSSLSFKEKPCMGLGCVKVDIGVQTHSLSAGRPKPQPLELERYAYLPIRCLHDTWVPIHVCVCVCVSGVVSEAVH